MCEYADRVHILEDLLLHPSTEESARINREEIRAQLVDAVLDLAEIRLTALSDNMIKMEGFLDNARARSPS